jgi:hypothetical protein
MFSGNGILNRATIYLARFLRTMCVRDRLWDILLYYKVTLIILHAMNAYVRVVVTLHSFQPQLWMDQPLSSGDVTTGSHCTGGWVGPETSTEAS